MTVGGTTPEPGSVCIYFAEYKTAPVSCPRVVEGEQTHASRVPCYMELVRSPRAVKFTKTLKMCPQLLCKSRHTTLEVSQHTAQAHCSRGLGTELSC